MSTPTSQNPATKKPKTQQPTEPAPAQKKIDWLQTLVWILVGVALFFLFSSIVGGFAKKEKEPETSTVSCCPSEDDVLREAQQTILEIQDKKIKQIKDAEQIEENNHFLNCDKGCKKDDCDHQEMKVVKKKVKTVTKIVEVERVVYVPTVQENIYIPSTTTTTTTSSSENCRDCLPCLTPEAKAKGLFWSSYDPRTAKVLNPDGTPYKGTECPFVGGYNLQK
jgi:hypothetical protein